MKYFTCDRRNCIKSHTNQKGANFLSNISFIYADQGTKETVDICLDVYIYDLLEVVTVHLTGKRSHRFPTRTSAQLHDLHCPLEAIKHK